MSRKTKLNQNNMKPKLYLTSSFLAEMGIKIKRIDLGGELHGYQYYLGNTLLSIKNNKSDKIITVLGTSNEPCSIKRLIKAIFFTGQKINMRKVNKLIDKISYCDKMEDEEY